MRRSKTVTLLLCTSLAIFGVGHVTGCDSGDQQNGYYDEDGNWVRVDEFDDWEPEPVYIDGVMGVYHPTTHVFIACTSPEFSSTCASIRAIHVSTIRAGGVSTVRGGFGAMGGHAGISA